MKSREIVKAVIWMVVGSLISTLSFHFRFKEDILLREMILIMESGSDYFLLFAYSEIFMLILMVGFYIMFYTKRFNNEVEK